jgi:hypothetical protein
MILIDSLLPTTEYIYIYFFCPDAVIRGPRQLQNLTVLCAGKLDPVTAQYRMFVYSGYEMTGHTNYCRTADNVRPRHRWRIILKKILLEQGITAAHVLSYFHSIEHPFFWSYRL